MYYVYLIKSIVFPDKRYVGCTSNLKERFQKHNEGGSKYTADNRPWKMIMYLAFEDKAKAFGFEKYLKSGSGGAFAKKRLW
jgi:putative endonuclease